MCLYGDILGQTGECAYTLECAYTVEWCGCGICVFCPCVEFFNDGTIDTCPDGRIFHLSFDWQTKVLVSNERHDCSAFNNTIPEGTPPTVCCQGAIGPHAVPIHLPHCNRPRLKSVSWIVLVYGSDKAEVDTLCPFMCPVREVVEASNAAVRQERHGGSPALYLAAVVMCMTYSFEYLARNVVASMSVRQSA